MQLDVFLTPDAVAERHVRDRTVVVIDVLRACSTIVTALKNGARGLVPVPDMEAASRLATNRNTEQFLLGGERHGVKIEGFDLGNSPLEYTPDVIHDRTVIFKTTNGTGAILKGAGARHLAIGCFLNAAAVVDFAAERGDNVTIICSGWRGMTSYEDTLCAGLIIERLRRIADVDALPDTSRIAHLVYRDAHGDIAGLLAETDHARRLVGLGNEADVSYCAQVDAVDAVPLFEEQTITLQTNRPAESG